MNLFFRTSSALHEWRWPLNWLKKGAASPWTTKRSLSSHSSVSLKRNQKRKVVKKKVVQPLSSPKWLVVTSPRYTRRKRGFSLPLFLLMTCITGVSLCYSYSFSLPSIVIKRYYHTICNHVVKNSAPEVFLGTSHVPTSSSEVMCSKWSPFFPSRWMLRGFFGRNDWRLMRMKRGAECESVIWICLFYLNSFQLILDHQSHYHPPKDMVIIWGWSKRHKYLVYYDHQQQERQVMSDGPKGRDIHWVTPADCMILLSSCSWPYGT